MKKIFLIQFFLWVFILNEAKNTGVGVSNASSAQLVVHGGDGFGNAEFDGGTTDISLGANWPLFSVYNF